MKKILILLSTFILLLLCSNHSRAGNITVNGQASAWVAFNDESQAGIRYIPELSISNPLAVGRDIDAEISLNSFIWAPIDSPSDFDAVMKLYRSWLRYSTARFEMRLGLQKINFGPAKVIRTLMWFDRLDLRDPLEFTEGVYAVLGRYYFLNNANIWIWGLYGNEDIKGLEAFKTDKNRMEFGGRYQFPLPKGEMALSFNRRYVDPEDWNRKMSDPLSDGLENRYAIDGVWDVGIGLWFEASIGEIKIESSQQMWRKLLTIGSDYTFESGIHLLCEHFIQSTGSEIDRSDEINNFSALSADYRINIVDSINAIGYYDWDQEKVYSYIGWKRTYDNWLMNLMAFSSREDGTGAFNGKGMQCMLTYNH